MTAMVSDTATLAEMPADTRRKVAEIFTREEVRRLNERSDLMGFVAVELHLGRDRRHVRYAGLGHVEAVVDRNPRVHRRLRRAGRSSSGPRNLASRSRAPIAVQEPMAERHSRRLACARPTWNDLQKYRAHHFAHHRRTSQPGDTDLSLVAGFPTTRASLARKLARDLVGLTGLKYLLGRTMMDAGLLQWTVANDAAWLPRQGRRWWSYPVTFSRNASGMLLTNAVLLGLCWASGHAWLYAVWTLSYVTPFPALSPDPFAGGARLRRDELRHVREHPQYARRLSRACHGSPIRVNFHIEHHVMPSVPYFRLPSMHRILRDRGAVGAPPTYSDVLKLVSSRPAG